MLTPKPAAPERLVSLVEELLPSVFEGQRRALGRAISLVENGDGASLVIPRIYDRTGKARVVGITGPPGAGKSTLVDRMAQLYRSRGETVGILAVDPSSPFSGGAVLGDRVRMQGLSTDPGVFIRSMATRGIMGGLARATRDAVDLLDAAGFDWILVETVGVGQDEVDVVRTVDTVLLVTVPGLGDEIQAIKAGIMEIADLFVVNKADRDGVEHTLRDLESMLSMAQSTGWSPPILRTVASRNQGMEELASGVDEHGDWLRESGELDRRRFHHLRRRVETILQERILTAADHLVDMEARMEKGFAEQTDPYSLAEHLFAEVVGSAQEPRREP